MHLPIITTNNEIRISNRTFPTLEAAQAWKAQTLQRRRERLGRDLQGEEAALGYAMRDRQQTDSRTRIGARMFKPVLLEDPASESQHPFDAFADSPAGLQMRHLSGERRESANEFRARARREFDAANSIKPVEPTADELKQRQHWRDVAHELYEAAAFTIAIPETTLLATINLVTQADHPRSDLAATGRMAAEIIGSIRALEAERDAQYRKALRDNRLDLPSLEPEPEPPIIPKKSQEELFAESVAADVAAGKYDDPKPERTAPLEVLPYDEPAEDTIARLNARLAK